MTQETQDLPLKLWIYTNYDCNLSCSYCVARSSPAAPRRPIGLKKVMALVDEAVENHFDCVYFTGGEPFLLDEIYDMLAYASNRILTIVLTNGMLFKGARLQKLLAVKNDRLVIQVSLDGAQPAHHDAYRGAGSWHKTVEGIRLLQQNQFAVRLSTTETPANTFHLDELCALHLSMGIPESDHLVRKLAKRGFSDEGIDVGMHNVVPEITVNTEGFFWHPLSTDEDLKIASSDCTLSEAVQVMRSRQAQLTTPAEEPVKPFK